MRILAGDGLVHGQHPPLARGVMPVGRRISAMARSAGDVNDAAGKTAFLPVLDCKPAQLRRSGQVDPHGVLPCVEPFDVRTIERVRIEKTSIVDQDVDFAASPGECGLPQFVRSTRLAEICRDGVDSLARRRLADDLRAACFERCLGSGADAAGGTCKEDGSHYAAVSKGKPHCHPCATRQLR